MIYWSVNRTGAGLNPRAFTQSSNTSEQICISLQRSCGRLLGLREFQLMTQPEPRPAHPGPGGAVGRAGLGPSGRVAAWGSFWGGSVPGGSVAPSRGPSPTPKGGVCSLKKGASHRPPAARRVAGRWGGGQQGQAPTAPAAVPHPPLLVGISGMRSRAPGVGAGGPQPQASAGEWGGEDYMRGGRGWLVGSFRRRGEEGAHGCAGGASGSGSVLVIGNKSPSARRGS